MQTTHETGRRLICIVDDDDSFREALAGWLASLGLRTASFGSASAFLESHGASAACFLVVDVNMPGMSGLDLLDRLAASRRSLPTVVISARDDAHVRIRALAAGAIAFLGKPFELQQLADLIQAAPCGCPPV
jgi:FixJ family two-component response regulator